MSIVIVVDLATGTILGISCVNENAEKNRPKRGTVELSGSSLVAIKESVGNAADLKNNLESSPVHCENDFNKFLCTAVCQKDHVSNV